MRWQLQSSGGEGIEDCVAGLAGGDVEVTDGNDVVVYTGDGAVATITHDGESNFAIWAYYADGRDLLVNEIGSYSGQQLLDDAVLLQITADGDWSIEAE